MAHPNSRLATLRQSLSPREWRRVGAMAALIAALHIIGWGVMVLVVMPHHYRLLGLGVGVTAYTLGMRHAFDADHISAIDNTTRKLMAEGQRPLSVGLFFSLGHSSVVFGLAVALTFAARTLLHQVGSSGSSLHRVTSTVGTMVSGGFLYAIAAINLVILAGIVRIFSEMRRGVFDEAELERQLDSRGMMNRFFGRLMRTVRAPWHMYPIGVLFGLGFDTASEVALLALAGGAASTGLPFYAILCLPVLFAAGMTLFDTIDGSFMNFAYGWAFSRPVRKVYYNVVITGLSVAVAFLIGTLELLSVLANQLRLHGGLWSYAAGFNLNAAGFFIVGMFVVTWLAALAFWRVARVEERWGPPAVAAMDLEEPVTVGAAT
ncbi:MAG TPA: HoxN/HupN/NixA family nickel/cobalt transporter [Acidimicrobiales bacterium]|nr:HoxN/HupN/NixA family nickel/cobalt transporter [Acidimicrobiales bacterium]